MIFSTCGCTVVIKEATGATYMYITERILSIIILSTTIIHSYLEAASASLHYRRQHRSL